MATRQTLTNLTMQSSTSAVLSAASTEIFSLFSSGGWVQTTDTGQTATGAWPGPVGTNLSSGYQIWRMNDALQVSGSTVFIKVEIGEGGATGFLSLWITIGTGSDGAGNITGSLLARTQLAWTTTVGSTTANFQGSAASDRYWFWFGPSTSAPHIGLSIERTKDAYGANTTDGIVLWVDINTATASGLKNFQVLRFVNNVLPNSTLLGAHLPSGSSYVDGNNVGMSPIRPFMGGVGNPITNLVAYLGGDLAAGVAVGMLMYGATRTYMPLGTNYVNTVCGGNGSSTLAGLWE